MTENYYLTSNDEIFFFQSPFYGRKVFKLNLNTKSFSTVNTSYPDLFYSAKFQIGSIGYFCTGDTVNANGFGKSKTCYSYNISENKWERIANFPLERRESQGFNIGKKGYILGETSYNDNKDIWEYDPLFNVWLKKQEIGGFLGYLTLFTTDNFFYFLHKQRLYKFNPVDASLIEDYFFTDLGNSYYPMFYTQQRAYILASSLYEYNLLTKTYKTYDNVKGLNNYHFIKEYNGKFYIRQDNQIFEVNPSLL